MNLRDFQYIVAVERYGHFGKAAEACHVSQPTLSGQIQKLEEELGLMIFERTRRSVRLTPAGAEIVQKARELLATLDSITEIAAELKDPKAGPLSLGVIPTIAPYLMPRLIPALARALPLIELQVKERFTHQIEAQLVEGSLDAAVIATEPSLPQLTSIPLYQEPFWVALPAGHAMSAEEEIELEALVGERLLLLSEEHCLRDQVLAAYPEKMRAASQVSTVETSLTTVLALVGGGFGITLVPAMSLSGPWVTDAGIMVRKEKTGLARRQVQLAYRRSFSRTAVVERLADLIAAMVPDTVFPYRR